MEYIPKVCGVWTELLSAPVHARFGELYRALAHIEHR